MRTLGAGSQRWLKGFHALSACLWVGAAVSMTAVQLAIHPVDGGELRAVTALMEFVDFFVIIPGAVGVLLTGLVYSIWTNWGWFKHNWILVKWIVCAIGVVFGTYPLGPWVSEVAQIAAERGADALQDSTFQQNQKMLSIFGTLQASTLVLAVFVTTLKPWKKKREGQ